MTFETHLTVLGDNTTATLSTSNSITLRNILPAVSYSSSATPSTTAPSTAAPSTSASPSDTATSTTHKIKGLMPLLGRSLPLKAGSALKGGARRVHISENVQVISCDENITSDGTGSQNSSAKTSNIDMASAKFTVPELTVQLLGRK